MNRRALGRSAACATLAVLLSSQAVWADDISNSLDASIDAVAEVMALNVGGANGTTTLYVQPRNEDGKNGCNLTGSATLVLSVGSSDSGVATVSPSSVTFTNCGTVPTLTVLPLTAGSATISVSQTSNNTGGTFNLTSATFTVNVAPPANSAPQVSISGVAAGASYEIGAVPSATCNVTDAEDGNSSFAATISGALTHGLGVLTASCDYTDGGGLTASASLQYSIVDTGDPVITLVSRLAAPNGAGWNNAPVVVTWSCTDAGGSGVIAATVTDTISADGANQTASGTCTDNAGNTASDTVTGINVDTVAPSIALLSRLPAPNGAGWNNSAVVVTWSCSDAGGSGVVDPEVTRTVSGDGAGQSASGTCTDLAGNSAPATESSINIDTVAPTIALLSRTPAANGAGWNNTDVTVTWTCTDGGSDVVAAQDMKTVSVEGADQSATGTCVDLADNSASDTVTGISIDKTAPSIADDGVSSGTAGTNGWYISAVVNQFTATDLLSGIPAGTNPILVSTGTREGTGITVNSAAVTDVAGNDLSGIDSAVFKIDLTDPTNVVFSSTLSGSYDFGSVPPAPTCTATDAISGIADCVVTGYGTGVGAHTLVATATDQAGRTMAIQASYTVLPWMLKGFYQPVDMGSVLNTVKAGSTVPLKFEAFAGLTELTDTSIVSSLIKTATCTTGAPEDTIEVTSTGATSLRYDPAGGQFIFNWQTPKLAGRCYTVTLTTLDGSHLDANFKLK